MWAADVSEGGFKWADGVALMPKAKDEADMEGTELARWVKLSDKERAGKQYDFKAPVEEIEVTQESRQEMFDNQETTDDHGMEIVGVAQRPERKPLLQGQELLGYQSGVRRLLLCFRALL